MKRSLPTACGLAVVMVALLAVAGDEPAADDWRVNATIIEACSCPMFCQCYFNPKPAGHGGHGGHASHASTGDGRAHASASASAHAGHASGEASDASHFCRFNMAFKINEGHHGSTGLEGVKFWIAGDLGSDFSEGKMDWAVLTFDEASTAEQREGVKAFIGTVFPVEWAAFRAGEGKVEWRAAGGTARATLDGGKTAEIELASKVNKQRKSEPTVIHNLAYWNARSNDGFVLMPNEVEAWRGDERAFEFRGSNGFMITIDADSQWAEKSAG